MIASEVLMRGLAIVGALVYSLVYSAAAWGQSVISAHSGVIHYIEGQVTVDGAVIHPKSTEFPDIKLDQVVATEDGRAEILLTPGVFLRLPENSSARMISNSLADTRLEIVSGSALIEVGQLLRNNAITIEARGVEIALPKQGLYRIDADPARLRVFDGEARVTSGAGKIDVKRGREVALDAPTLEARAFDAKSTDPFYRWSARRSEYVAEANVISARTASDSGYGSGFASGGYGSWAFNPWFGMFTYLPASGIYWSPFGSPFYSPGIISYVYFPRGISAAPGGVVATPRAPVTSSGLGGGGVRPTASPRMGGARGGGFAGGGAHASGGGGTRGR
jgi:FecR protein